MSLNITVDDPRLIILHEVRGLIGIGEIAIAMRKTNEHPSYNQRLVDIDRGEPLSLTQKLRAAY